MFYAIIGLLFLLADQFLKYWTVSHVELNANPGIELAKYLNLTYIKNDTVFFGLLDKVPYLRWILLGLLAAFTLFIVLGVAKGFLRTFLSRLSGTLLLAGLLGNGIDRAIYGYVVDMLEPKIGNMSLPIFNVADCLVAVFGVLFFISILAGGLGAPYDDEDDFDDEEEDLPPRRRRREEDEEDLPRRRRSETEADRPRRRRPEDEEDRPRRRRPEGEEERPRRRRPEGEEERPRRRRPEDGAERPRRPAQRPQASGNQDSPDQTVSRPVRRPARTEGIDDGKVQTVERPAPEVKPAPAPEAKPAPVPEVKPAPVPEAKPAPVPEAKPAPVPEVKPTPAPDAKPAVTAIPEPVPDEIEEEFDLDSILAEFADP